MTEFCQDKKCVRTDNPVLEPILLVLGFGVLAYGTVAIANRLLR